MPDKLENFVIFPRYIADLLRNKEINLKEFLLLTWLRINADPYGVTKTSLDALAYDIGETKNYTNKLLLSLKSKNLIAYEKRVGFRGSFKIHLDFWVLPDKTVKGRGVFFSEAEIRTMEKKSQSRNPSSVSDIQRSKTIKDETTQVKNDFTSIDKFRGTNTDTDKDKNTHTQDGIRKSERGERPYYDPSTGKIVENPY